MPRRQRTALVAAPPTRDDDFDLSPALEAELNALARAGRHDPAARNALHARLWVKTARFLAPWRGRTTPLGDFDDLRQEAFVVFADMVIGWSGEGSFARYFLGFFPWRLRHAIMRQARRWPAGRLVVIPHDDLLALAHGDPLAAVADDTILALGSLPDDERRLLALRLAGHTLPSAAAHLGWSPRTAARRWRSLRARLSAGTD